MDIRIATARKSRVAEFPRKGERKARPRTARETRLQHGPQAREHARHPRRLPLRPVRHGAAGNSANWPLPQVRLRTAFLQAVHVFRSRQPLRVHAADAKSASPKKMPATIARFSRSASPAKKKPPRPPACAPTMPARRLRIYSRSEFLWQRLRIQGFCVGLIRISLTNDCGLCVTSIATACATSSGCSIFAGSLPACGLSSVFVDPGQITATRML